MHITQSVDIQRQRVTLQIMQLVLKVIYFTTEIHFCNYFYSSVMYNNKQDFIPPLVIYGIVYLTNTESFLYFLNKAYGLLGYHSAQEL